MRLLFSKGTRAVNLQLLTIYKIHLPSGYLLDKMLSKFGGTLLTNTTETIQLISVIVNKRSRQDIVDADDVLLTSFDILRYIFSSEYFFFFSLSHTHTATLSLSVYLSLSLCLSLSLSSLSHTTYPRSLFSLPHTVHIHTHTHAQTLSFWLSRPPSLSAHTSHMTEEKR